MRLVTNFKTATTVSFRLASSKMFDFYGANLQNSPQELLPCVEAEPGQVFVQVDQSGAEAVIVAYVCRAGTFRELFIQEIKPHVFVALHLFVDYFSNTFQQNLNPLLILSPKELKALPFWKALVKLIKNSERQYSSGKMVCHAANYGMGVKAFILNVLTRSEGKLVLSYEEARTFLTLYHTLFPEITEWHGEVEHTLHHGNRTLRNLFGYPCTFHERRTHDTVKLAYSWGPQSTVAVITHKAALSFTKLRKFPVLNNKHDSYLVQCPQEAALDTARLMIRTISDIPLISPKDSTPFTMKAEVKIGRNWGNYDPITNPEGMKEIDLA